MEYNFDEVIDRRGTDSEKWDRFEGALPLWVADMDFRAAPEVQAALRARVEHGVFGYSIVPDRWYRAYQDWWRQRHGLEMEAAWLQFCTGVVPAISSVVRKLTAPGDAVALMTPVYNIFFNSVVNNGRVAVECPLAFDGRRYAIDFDALERTLAEPRTTMLLLCNPHNPVGVIWSADELGRIGELCARHGVVVVADEIHCDVTAPGRGYVPFAGVSAACRDNSVTCLSPSKAFNVAGLHSAAVCVPDEALRAKVRRALNDDEIAEPNSFAVDGACAAFEAGGPWLDALREYLWGNRRAAEAFLDERVPGMRAVPAEATYLLWIDARERGEGSRDLRRRIQREAGVVLCDGASYGAAGEGFLRLNLACPRSVLMEALERMAAALA